MQFFWVSRGMSNAFLRQFQVSHRLFFSLPNLFFPFVFDIAGFSLLYPFTTHVSHPNASKSLLNTFRRNSDEASSFTISPNATFDNPTRYNISQTWSCTVRCDIVPQLHRSLVLSIFHRVHRLLLTNLRHKLRVTRVSHFFSTRFLNLFLSPLRPPPFNRTAVTAF